MVCKVAEPVNNNNNRSIYIATWCRKMQNTMDDLFCLQKLQKWLMSLLCMKFIIYLMADIWLLCYWQITVADLEAVLTKDQQMFRENPDIWLKDLASFINIQLANYGVPVSDTVFEGKPPGRCHYLLTISDMIAFCQYWDSVLLI